MADKKKKASKKKTSKKGKAKATPEMEENVDAEAEANETPAKSGDESRVWYVEPKQAASLKTSRGVIVKGRPIPVVEGSPDYNFYKSRSDVSLSAKLR